MARASEGVAKVELGVLASEHGLFFFYPPFTFSFHVYFIFSLPHLSRPPPSSSPPHPLIHLLQFLPFYPRTLSIFLLILLLPLLLLPSTFFSSFPITPYLFLSPPHPPPSPLLFLPSTFSSSFTITPDLFPSSAPRLAGQGFDDDKGDSGSEMFCFLPLYCL